MALHADLHHNTFLEFFKYMLVTQETVRSLGQGLHLSVLVLAAEQNKQ